MKYSLLLFFAGFNLYANNYPVKIGNSTVIIQHQEYGEGKTFVHLHQNETTALQAARVVAHAEGGSILTLVHLGERNIIFHLHKRRYEFDPNRIFTDAGIKKTLVQFGHYTPQAHAEVKKLADMIKKMLPKGKVIAVHNNKSYSLKDYFPGESLASDAKALNFHVQNHFRNFYLVTKHVDYFRLKKLQFNSVLQARNATDDGSLSVYLSGSNYVNVEAGYDQLIAQVNMLKYA